MEDYEKIANTVHEQMEEKPDGTHARIFNVLVSRWAHSPEVMTQRIIDALTE